MKIIDIQVKRQSFKLVKPYKITNQLIDKVENCIVSIELDNGLCGYGAGAPIDFVTGETMTTALSALQPSKLAFLYDQSILSLPALSKQLQKAFQETPAAHAAIDIALWDAYAKMASKPLVDILGRAHDKLPTSITIGIKEINAAILEAKEYIKAGFKILKIKLGEEPLQDLELVFRLKEILPQSIKLRVDMNQGYTLEEFKHFLDKTKSLDLELFEQPIAKDKVKELATVAPFDREKVALDENLMTVEEGFELVAPEKLSGIFNIKLMKCGGISEALRIADLASYAGLDLMWGCMDESKISIAAALHTALASAKTKYLDLDGSFDLVEDIVNGGFLLEEGYLRTNDEQPGLGVEMTG